jgi:hypothetical protein
MSNYEKPQKGSVPGKPYPPSGISPELVQQLRSRISELEKSLQKQMAEADQWNSEVRGWVGRIISILLTSGVRVTGTLVKVTRYTMLVEGPVPGTSHTNKPMVVPKGAVDLVYPEDEAAAAI